MYFYKKNMILMKNRNNKSDLVFWDDQNDEITLDNKFDIKILSLIGKGHMLDKDELDKITQITEKYKYL
jgi:hypothetical protein